jgi:hypothetical protein
MTIQLANLRIQRVIAHQIFDRPITGDAKEPNCSTQCTPMIPSGMQTLQTRITEALGNDSHSIEMYITQSEAGSVYSYCNKLLTSNDATFVEISQELAKKLAQSQTSRNIPGGILVVFDGLIGYDNKKIIGLIKAEIHEGFGLKTTSNALFLDFISKLLLTPSQKLYKIGIFVETKTPQNEDLRDPECYEVLVYDHNLMNKTETAQAAKYFYELFLGCGFCPSDKKLTRDFYFFTKEYIEQMPLEKDIKLDLHNSLYSYLKVSQSNVVEIAGFSQEYLDADYRDGYRTFMTENKVPEHAITKDLEYINNKLKRRQIHFTSEVKIIAPSDNFDELVKIITPAEQNNILAQILAPENDMTLVAIKGDIERTE